VVCVRLTTSVGIGVVVMSSFDRWLLTSVSVNIQQQHTQHWIHVYHVYSRLYRHTMYNNHSLRLSGLDSCPWNLQGELCGIDGIFVQVGCCSTTPPSREALMCSWLASVKFCSEFSLQIQCKENYSLWRMTWPYFAHKNWFCHLTVSKHSRS